jgi:hypothetical protein
LTSTSDHTPLLIDIAVKICHKVETKVVRNWSGYSKERLLYLMSKEKWDIDCYEVQDFNNKLEKTIMSVLEFYLKHARRWIRKSEKVRREATRRKFVARFFSLGRIVSGMQ